MDARGVWAIIPALTTIYFRHNLQKIFPDNFQIFPIDATYTLHYIKCVTFQTKSNTSMKYLTIQFEIKAV